MPEDYYIEDKLAPHCGVGSICRLDPDSEECKRARQCAKWWFQELLEYWWWVRIRDTLRIPEIIGRLPLSPGAGPDPVPPMRGPRAGDPDPWLIDPRRDLLGRLQEEALLDDLLGRNALGKDALFPSLRDRIREEGLHVKAALSLADRLSEAADMLRKEADMLAKLD